MGFVAASWQVPSALDQPLHRHLQQAESICGLEGSPLEGLHQGCCNVAHKRRCARRPMTVIICSALLGTDWCTQACKCSLAVSQAQLMIATSPPAYDARNRAHNGGFSAVGPVKDQADCNTCVRQVVWRLHKKGLGLPSSAACLPTRSEAHIVSRTTAAEAFQGWCLLQGCSSFFGLLLKHGVPADSLIVADPAVQYGLKSSCGR